MKLLMTFLDNNMEKISISKIMLELPNEIQKKISKYYRLEDQYRTALGYMMLKNELKERGNSEMKIIYGKYGKPYLKSNQSLYFNISHSHNMIVCALDSEEIGVDVEYEKTNEKNNIDLAKRFFHNREYDRLSNKTSLSEKQNYFYKLWTAKESYIKWVGQGLYLDLKDFAIDCSLASTILEASKENKGCYFKYYFLDKYHLHICSSSQERLNSCQIKHINEISV